MNRQTPLHRLPVGEAAILVAMRDRLTDREVRDALTLALNTIADMQIRLDVLTRRGATAEVAR